MTGTAFAILAMFFEWVPNIFCRLKKTKSEAAKASHCSMFVVILFQFLGMQYQFLAVACLMAVARREGVSDTFLSRKWE